MFDHFSTFCMIRLRSLHLGLTNYTAQKVKFSIKYFFSKWDQIHSKLQIWSHLLKKYLMENFCAVLRVRISMSTLPNIFNIWSISGPHFPTFGLNTEIYSANLRIQSKWRKMRARKTPNTDNFHVVTLSRTLEPNIERRIQNPNIYLR